MWFLIWLVGWLVGWFVAYFLCMRFTKDKYDKITDSDRSFFFFYCLLSWFVVLIVGTTGVCQSIKKKNERSKVVNFLKKHIISFLKKLEPKEKEEKKD